MPGEDEFPTRAGIASTTCASSLPCSKSAVRRMTASTSSRRTSLRPPHAPQGAAAEKLEREAKARAERLRVEHEELEKGVKEARAAETHRKRVVIAGVEEGKAVPMEDLVRGGFPTDPVAATEEATDGGSEGLPGLAMFARFFGFRKRGSGQHLSSVVL